MEAATTQFVQWLAPPYCTPCLIRHPEGDILGYYEQEVAYYIGKTVQFERTRFVKVDFAADDGVIVYYSHKIAYENSD